MGYFNIDLDEYQRLARHRKATGTPDFDWDAKARTSGRYTVHDTLNPYGVTVRESRDSAGHPSSTAVGVLLDVTGSMGSIPMALQKKLPELMGLLMTRGYVEHPQILFGGIGDATCDRVPLQIGQFEADNAMDEQLRNLILEGGGGGQMTESYELAMYFMARHTDLDCWNKRRQKGYLFMIGDEMPYGQVDPIQVERLIGDRLQASISVEHIVSELKKRYEVFYIMPTGADHSGEDRVLRTWKNLLGQHVLQLTDNEAVCEVILSVMALDSGLRWADVQSQLLSGHASASAVAAAGKAVELYKPSGTGIAGIGNLLPGFGGKSKTKRL